VCPSTFFQGWGYTIADTSVQAEDEQRYAREKFGVQKGISSDEFFGRNAFDPQAQSEARTRLQDFEGASAISSNSYFGREEEDPGSEATYGGGDLEVTAREFARRFAGTAGEDLENITQALGQGASKLQDALKQYVY
jgi:ADP-ribosylation factor GTPase-activating protein 2/3